MRTQRFLSMILVLIASRIDAMCPATSPWSTPMQLTNAGIVTSDVFSAATAAGFMAVWADSSNNANYSFSSDGNTWQSGLVTPAQGNVASNSDVFVAGNATGFLVTWVDSSANGWSSFTADNGNTWSVAQQINPNTLTLDSNSDVYVAGGPSGFVAGLLVPDTGGNTNDDLYVTFSTGTSAWSAPVLAFSPTNINTVLARNPYTQTNRAFVSIAIVDNSCVISWIAWPFQIYAISFTSINPFSPTLPTPNYLFNVGQFQSVPILATFNGYYIAATQANVGPGVIYFSIGTNSANFATTYTFAPTSPFNAPNASPWMAANQAGFMSTWNVSGNPVWQLSTDIGFDWTTQCSILNVASNTIQKLVPLSANARGFVATWIDSNDLNAYASFYFTPSSSAAGTLFAGLLQQKYGPLL